ncbi:MAG: MFS transporter [Nitrososphaerota archaeon]|nr:MFS transporter [Nitrososphaerota archaeon]
MSSSDSGWLSRGGLLVSLSAFFADMGYQAVAAVFPLYLVFSLHQPVYVYGVLISLSFGVGSLFSLVGGRYGDRVGRKKISILGNSFIPLMALSALTNNVALAGALFVAGWWARYFRTPARRALLVDITDPSFRSKVFGFLHGLDIGGGMLAALYSLIFVVLGVPYRDIILVTLAPLVVSTLCLLPVDPTPHVKLAAEAAKQTPAAEGSRNGFVFRMLLLSSMFFGFGYYAFGFPILTVAQSQGGASYAILAFVIYLGVSGAGGYLLGAAKVKPLRTLWSGGYLLGAISSLGIGLSYLMGSSLPLYYAASAALGLATGSVETFEPTLTSKIVSVGKLSGGMGMLSMTRAMGLFVANLVMGVLFTFGQFDAYLYACLMSLVAAGILAATERRA